MSNIDFTELKSSDYVFYTFKELAKKYTNLNIDNGNFEGLALAVSNDNKCLYANLKTITYLKEILDVSEYSVVKYFDLDDDQLLFGSVKHEYDYEAILGRIKEDALTYIKERDTSGDSVVELTLRLFKHFLRGVEFEALSGKIPPISLDPVDLLLNNLNDPNVSYVVSDYHCREAGEPYRSDLFNDTELYWMLAGMRPGGEVVRKLFHFFTSAFDENDINIDCLNRHLKDKITSASRSDNKLGMTLDTLHGLGNNQPEEKDLADRLRQQLERVLNSVGTEHVMEAELFNIMYSSMCEQQRKIRHNRFS
tara:strand:- start:51526 stop:52449 length:924 start_codon:yes stop_codon:yes gene_type:complete